MRGDSVLERWMWVAAFTAAVVLGARCCGYSAPPCCSIVGPLDGLRGAHDGGGRCGDSRDLRLGETQRKAALSAGKLGQ